MSVIAICERCGREYEALPPRDKIDGGWYCRCGGDLEPAVICEECGKYVSEYRASSIIADDGSEEFYCTKCFEQMALCRATGGEYEYE